MNKFLRALKPFVVLILFASFCGLISNSLNDRGVSLIYIPMRVEAGMTVTSEQAKVFFDRKEAQFIDAREEGEFLIEHIPGALNIPFNANQETKQLLFKQLSKKSNIIVYCMDPTCNAAERIVGEMLFSGFESVVMISNGLESWMTAGYPLEVYDQ